MKMRKRFGRSVAWVVLSAVSSLSAQTNENQLRESLVGQPLYLRGLWHENTLAFDGSGKPVGKATPGALTLSGVDVTSVSVRGKKLVLEGERVALVADADGVLKRKTPSSSTVIFGSLMPKDKRVFKAKEEMKITLEADAAGSYDAALKAVFANGLAELATSAPPYWSCYAEGYFRRKVPAGEAEKTVQDCVMRKDLSEVKGEEVQGDYVPPKFTGSESPVFPHEAAELGAGGTVRLHCTVTRKGLTVGFQVVQAVGAGVDEALLTFLYRSKFEPGRKDGLPVNADYEAKYEFRTAR